MQFSVVEQIQKSFFYRLGLKDGLNLKKYGKISIRNDIVKSEVAELINLPFEEKQ